jgi:hypothetical protein
MRISGDSIRDIEFKLGIPKSTLSGWFKNIKISKRHKSKLDAKWRNALIKARTKAAAWHNREKDARILMAQNNANLTLKKIDIENKEIMELALSILYLGEGFKRKSVTGIGNSDPMILLFFVNAISKIYNIEVNKMRCNLHLRADQDSEKLKLYWSNVLGIPVSNFGKASIDKRTHGTKTYDSYKGVCVVRCGNIAIQRKLIYLSKIYCESINTKLGG